MSADIKQIAELVKQKSEFVHALFAQMDKVIVGQRYMLERMLIGLLADGHILLEGVPGLAKTMAVTALMGSASSFTTAARLTHRHWGGMAAP